MTKKQRIRNPDLTRERILNATLELVSEKGVEALSMKEAASRAGVSRSVAYLHFANREELLKEANNTVSTRLMEEIVTFDKNDSLEKRVLHLAKVILDNPEAAKILMVDSLNGSRLSYSDPLFKMTYDILKSLQDDGIYAIDADIEVSTYIQLSTIMTILLIREQHQTESIDALAERYSKEMSRMLKSQYIQRN